MNNVVQYPVLERRISDNPWKAAAVGERRHRAVPGQPLPAADVIAELLRCLPRH